MKIKTYVEMEWRELDSLAEKHLGIEYESAAENEWNNDSSYTFSIRKEPLDKWDATRLADFVAGKRSGNLWAHIVLTELVNRDIIPAGNYLIAVSW